jgi:hypothetical protein
MTKCIEVIVAPDGSTRVETRGFWGNECCQASQFLEAALGKPRGEQLTAEFYQTSDRTVSIQQATEQA